jgi:hypothetical protein
MQTKQMLSYLVIYEGIKRNNSNVRVVNYKPRPFGMLEDQACLGIFSLCLKRLMWPRIMLM